MPRCWCFVSHGDSPVFHVCLWNQWIPPYCNVKMFYWKRSMQHSWLRSMTHWGLRCMSHVYNGLNSSKPYRGTCRDVTIQFVLIRFNLRQFDSLQCDTARSCLIWFSFNDSVWFQEPQLDSFWFSLVWIPLIQFRVI